MEKNLNPEERLLRLIRNKNKEAGNNKQASASQDSEERLKPALKPAVGVGAYLFLRGFLQKIFSIKKLNIVLISLIVVAFGYMVFEILFFRDLRLEQPKAAEKVDTKPEAKEKISQESLPFDYYANQINKRDIFKPAFEQDQASQGTLAKSTLAEQAANLRLSGIIVDKQPQAIIEDTKLKKTYFLYKGDYIGEIKIEEILESKVVLSYSGEKFELVP